jgi:hypothetical protein
MNDERIIRQGDVPKVIMTMAFRANALVDLTQFTGGITFRMVGPVTIAGAATGDAAGNLSCVLDGTDTDVVGEYQLTFRGLDGSGTPQTFPESTNLRVRIIAAI